MYRYILVTLCLSLICVFNLTCSKPTDLASQNFLTNLSRTNAFPSSFTMPEDKTINYSTFDTIKGYQAFMNTCGVSPEFEAPNMGIDFYTIDGPTNTTTQKGSNFFVLNNLSSGTYKVVGHLYVTGYRSCDDSLMNDNIYDTMNLRVKSDVQPTITSITKSKGNLVISYQILSNTTSSYSSIKLYCTKDGNSFIFLRSLFTNSGSVSIKPVKNYNNYIIEVTENTQYQDMFVSPIKSF